MNEFALRAELDKAVARVRRLRKQMREVKRKAHGEPKRRKGRGCGLDRDLEAMAARDLKDPSSYIRRDGSEKLVGVDWDRRVDELRERSGGQCEHVAPCVNLGIDDVTIGPMRCPVNADDPHHKIKRSVRRDDRLSNLIHLCRWHHTEIDPRKIRSGKAGAVPALESSKKALGVES